MDSRMQSHTETTAEDGPASASPGSAPSRASHQRELRNALGTFPTGVAIMTTRTACGRNVGLTCNSFNSVSLSPPLILWSLAKRSALLQDFLAAPHFCVNVLGVGQQEVSRKFAGRADRFAGTSFSQGMGGIPVLAGVASHFQCSTEHQYDGGDHMIFIGRVVDFVYSDLEPLVYHRGQYASLEFAYCWP